jgi:signal transduction histidine kinase
LPENSLVVDFSEPGSSAGRAVPSEEAMQRMSEVSPAPIYGVIDPVIAYGRVGAVTTPIDAIGPASAAMVRQVLSRENPDSLPAVQSLAAAPLVDWRQLRRWHLRKIQLPPRSVVRFEPRSFWRQHLLLVITSGGLFLLQTGLILALVLQSRRRRRAELEARRRREELAHMTRVATMGELTASLAHEINQPLAAILSNAQAGQRLLRAGDGHLDEIRDILADIAADDQRAGEVIRRMRTLLRKGEFNPTELDVNDMVDEVVGLVRGEMILQNVSLTLELSPRLCPVHGDRVQLQQVLLNLMVNALDAMKEASGGNRRVVVRSAASGADSVEVSVEDSGVGVPADKLERIFEPFVTTKAHGMGLGLAICRSIIQAHGGRIGSSNNSGRGATFWFTLPAPEESKP